MEFNPVGVAGRWIFGVPGILDPGAIRVESLRDCYGVLTAFNLFAAFIFMLKAKSLILNFVANEPHHLDVIVFHSNAKPERLKHE